MVRIIEFFGSGFVWMREADAGDVGGSIFADPEEPCDPLLDSGVLLQCVYWTFGSFCGSWAWRNGEWSCIFLNSDDGFSVQGIGHG